MKIVTSQGETTLSELVDRLFAPKGPKAAELTRQAESALLRANPHLRGQKKLPAGTLVVVPDVPGLAPGATTPTLALEQDVLSQLRQTLTGARAALERSFASETLAVETTSALVKSREMKVLVKPLPDLQDRLAQVTIAAKAAQKSIAARKAAGDQDLAQLEKDLGQFSG